MSDFMEIGDSGLVPQREGWFLNKRTNELIDPDGRVYTQEMELVFDPFEDDQ